MMPVIVPSELVYEKKNQYLLPFVFGGWLDWWEKGWETSQIEVWTADYPQCH